MGDKRHYIPVFYTKGRPGRTGVDDGFRQAGRGEGWDPRSAPATEDGTHTDPWRPGTQNGEAEGSEGPAGPRKRPPNHSKWGPGATPQ
jgi:hypothetical protein